jgi:sulfate permease, SulP family
MSTAPRLAAPEPTFAELFTPKLITVLREGYDAKKFRADAVAGLTVAVFGASMSIATALEQIGRFPKAVVLDLSAVPLADSTAASSLRAFADRARRHEADVFIAGASPNVRHVLVRLGLRPPLVRYAPSVADARMAARHPAEMET